MRTLFRDQNVGCGRGVSEAITWMLESEEYGAIVEDDCIVSPDFFRLCEELLPMYKDDERVVEVSAFNPLGVNSVKESYFFNLYPGGCGWATWRRAWRHIDFEMKSWRTQRLRLFLRFNPLEAIIRLWEGQKVYRSTKVWDFQWMLYVTLERRLCITTCANLTQNIGIGVNATNTHTAYKPWANARIGDLQRPLQHPACVAINRYEVHRRNVEFLRRYATLLALKIIGMLKQKGAKPKHP